MITFYTPIEKERKGKERGAITSEDIKEIKNVVKILPKSKIRPKKLDEIYYEGKMLE